MSFRIWKGNQSVEPSQAFECEHHRCICVNSACIREYFDFPLFFFRFPLKFNVVALCNTKTQRRRCCRFVVYTDFYVLIWQNMKICARLLHATYYVDVETRAPKCDEYMIDVRVNGHWFILKCQSLCRIKQEIWMRNKARRIVCPEV